MIKAGLAAMLVLTGLTVTAQESDDKAKIAQLEAKVKELSAKPALTPAEQAAAYKKAFADAYAAGGALCQAGGGTGFRAEVNQKTGVLTQICEQYREFKK